MHKSPQAHTLFAQESRASALNSVRSAAHCVLNNVLLTINQADMDKMGARVLSHMISKS